MEASLSPTSNTEQPEEYSFKGIATNLNQLLKLIQEHNEASTKANDSEKTQGILFRMLTIVNDVQSKVQNSQSLGKSEREVVYSYKKERLKRQISATMAARKSLEIMCSSVGKETEVISKELARTVHEINGIEEHVNDLKAQNEMLSAKVEECVQEHGNKKKPCNEGNDGDTSNIIGSNVVDQGNAALLERNKSLSEQLLNTLEGYRSLKRKLKQIREENHGISDTMEDLAIQVQAGLDQICRLNEKIAAMDHEKIS